MFINIYVLMDEEMASLYILEFKKTKHWHFEFQRPIYILGDVICAY